MCSGLRARAPRTWTGLSRPRLRAAACWTASSGGTWGSPLPPHTRRSRPENTTANYRPGSTHTHDIITLNHPISPSHRPHSLFQHPEATVARSRVSSSSVNLALTSCQTPPSSGHTPTGLQGTRTSDGTERLVEKWIFFVRKFADAFPLDGRRWRDSDFETIKKTILCIFFLVFVFVF